MIMCTKKVCKITCCWHESAIWFTVCNITDFFLPLHSSSEKPDWFWLGEKVYLLKNRGLTAYCNLPNTIWYYLRKQHTLISCVSLKGSWNTFSTWTIWIFWECTSSLSGVCFCSKLSVTSPSSFFLSNSGTSSSEITSVMAILHEKFIYGGWNKDRKKERKREGRKEGG